MTIFIYGSDAYRLKRAKLNIIDEYRKKYSGGVITEYFNFLENVDLGKIQNILKNNSFFNEHKLVVCSNVFSNKILADKLMELVVKYDLVVAKDATILIDDNMGEKELNAKFKNALGLLTGKGAISKTYDILEGHKLHEWIQSEVKQRGCLIQEEAVKRLAVLCASDSWALINEIEKLTLYKKGAEIAPIDVDSLVSRESDLNIFDFTDAISTGNGLRTFEILYRELKNGRDPYYLLTMVIHQFRNLLMIKDLMLRGLNSQEISNKAGLHPFVVKKTGAKLAGLEIEELKLAYRALLNIDLRSKNGVADIKNSLYSFVIGNVRAK